MKLLSIFLLAFLGIAGTFNVAKAGQPIMSYESSVIDYGTIEQNADGERTFTFTNTGDEPLVITQCKKSCGCTVPTCPKEAILPGEEGTITVKYDTKRVGPFTKTVTIHTNSEEKTITLKIKGKVLAS